MKKTDTLDEVLNWIAGMNRSELCQKNPVAFKYYQENGIYTLQVEYKVEIDGKEYNNTREILTCSSLSHFNSACRNVFSFIQFLCDMEYLK